MKELTYPLYPFYCNICKSELDRMELGYNPHGLECNRWQCKILDFINLILLFIIGIPLMIIFIPIFIIIICLNFIEDFGRREDN